MEGGGLITPYRGIRFQRGGGLGSLFVRLARALIPAVGKTVRVGSRILKSRAGKRALKEIAQTSADVLADVGGGEKPKKAIKRRLGQGIARYAEPHLRKYAQSGGGRGKKYIRRRRRKI